MSRNLAPTKREQNADDQRDRRGLAGHFFLVAGARAVGQTREQGDQRNGFDHDEEDHEEFDELFDHVMLLRAKFTYCANALIGS